MKNFFCAMMLVAALTLPLYAAPKMTLAVIDFQHKDVSWNDSVKITELIRNEMINMEEYIIVERSQTDKILKEQGFQMTGCTDISCAVQVGKLLSARKMLVGTVMAINNKLAIVGRIIDVEKGVAEFSEREIVESRDDLFNAVVRFCNKLNYRITGKAPEKKPEPALKNKSDSVKVRYYSYSASDADPEPWGWVSLGFGVASLTCFGVGGIYYQVSSFNLISSSTEFITIAGLFFGTLPPEAALLLYMRDRAKDKKDKDDRIKTRNNIFIAAGAAGGVSLISLITYIALYASENAALNQARQPGDIALYMPPPGAYRINGAGRDMINLGLGVSVLF